jgi:hypothetical protein
VVQSAPWGTGGVAALNRRLIAFMPPACPKIAGAAARSRDRATVQLGVFMFTAYKGLCWEPGRAQATRIVEWVVPLSAADNAGNPQENLSHSLKVAGSPTF